MSLYFSTAVWGSLALAGFGLVKHLLPRYRVRAPLSRADAAAGCGEGAGFLKTQGFYGRRVY